MINEQAIKEGFQKAKQDITLQAEQVDALRRDIIVLQNQIYQILEKIGSIGNTNGIPSSIPPTELKETLREVLKEMHVYDKKNGLDINKKDIVKEKIIEAVEETSIPLPRLKEFIVDGEQYCSKASFYRYIDELKNDGKIILDGLGNGAIVKANRIEIVK